MWPPIWRRARHATTNAAPAPAIRAAAARLAQQHDCDQRRHEHGGCGAQRMRPAGAGGEAVGAGHGQRRHDRGQGGARRRAGSNQGYHHVRWRRQGGEGASARQQPQDQRERAIAADPRVPHDAQLVLARAAAAEAVGDVGEAVLVQRAGQPDRRGERHRGGGQRRQAEPEGQRIAAAAEQTDQRADHRKHHDARPEAAPRSRRFRSHRQTGQECECHLAVVDRVGEHVSFPRQTRRWSRSRRLRALMT